MRSPEPSRRRPDRLLLATTNPGKTREIEAVLKPLGLELLALSDLPGPLPEVPEDAATFMGNAEKKALHYAGLTGLVTLADDSGLEVDALGGEPGVQSARFAGPNRDAAANNARLIQRLAGVPAARRAARFRCAMAVAGPEGILARAEGLIEGLIVDQPAGSGGFGYDPHFYVPSLARTAAELSPADKNRVSHRGQALRGIARWLTGESTRASPTARRA